MSTFDPAALARAATPEIAVVVTALVALLVDVVLLRGRDAAARMRVGGAIAVAGLVVAAAFLGQHLWASSGGFALYADPARVFVENGLSITLRLALVGTTIGVVLLSIDHAFTKHAGEYYALTLFAALGAMVLVSTDNLLMLFVGLELLSVCLYALTAMHRGLMRSAEGAMKYFLVGALSSAFLLFGLSWVVAGTGAVTLQGIAEAGARMQEHPLLPFTGLVFVLVGLGFKIAVVPFHAWAPDAYEGAPTPVTAFIATASKIAAFFVGAKLLIVGFPALKGSASWTVGMELRFTAGWALLLALVAVASMVWGNVAAVAQTNVKRMLAYSSVAHAGYILIGVIAGDRASLTAILYYVVGYALANLGAFGVIAALTKSARGDDLEDLDGMVRRAPGLSLLLMVFLLSLAGIPPLAGFYGKFALFAGAVQADLNGPGLLWLVVVALATSAVSLYYYLIVLKHVFVHPARVEGPAETTLTARATLTVIGLLVVVIGAYPEPFVRMFADALMMAGVG